MKNFVFMKGIISNIEGFGRRNFLIYIIGKWVKDMNWIFVKEKIWMVKKYEKTFNFNDNLGCVK